METILIKVDNKENMSFLLNLLRKLNFIAEIQQSTISKIGNLSKYASSPIQWAESKPSFSDFSGIWKDRQISLNQLREKAWKRS